MVLLIMLEEQAEMCPIVLTGLHYVQRKGGI